MMNFNLGSFPEKYISLLEHVTGSSITAIVLNDEFFLTSKQEQQLASLIEDAKKGVPYEYLTNKAYFYKDSFFVNSYVLIPRPETELLIEKGISFIQNKQSQQVHIVDMCTGSGCIGLTLRKHLPIRNTATLIDISKEALVICRKNAECLLPNEKSISIIQSDLFMNYTPPAPIDLLVSNPPYISSDDIEMLTSSVKDYEPHLALDGGKEGIEVIIKLLTQAKPLLAPDAAILIEMDEGQETTVVPFARSLYPKAIVTASKDLFGLTRYLEIYLH